MSIENNKALVRDYFGRFVKRDFDGIAALMTDDATWWIAGKTDLFPFAGTKSKAEICGILREFLGSMPEPLNMQIRSIIAEGDTVAAEISGTGVFPNGASYDNQYHFAIEVRDGKISEVREYFDMMYMASLLA